MKLFHMLLKNDSGKYMKRFCDIYIEQCAGFAANYYEELYRRKLVFDATNKKSLKSMLKTWLKDRKDDIGVYLSIWISQTDARLLR